MGNTNGVRALDEDEVLLLLRTRNEELRQETKELREAIAEKDAALLKAKDDSTAALLKTKDDSAEASRQVAQFKMEKRDLIRSHGIWSVRGSLEYIVQEYMNSTVLLSATTTSGTPICPLSASPC